ncbi:MAG TPA: hypothetical protein VKQ30_20760 [Ktedonobacterales bacterium]|nr:hypothetical protein [Ktedonobacterales bacterium]
MNPKMIPAELLLVQRCASAIARPFTGSLNFSTRRVGGLRFVKLGRFTFMFCLSRTYRPMEAAR